MNTIDGAEGPPAGSMHSQHEIDSPPPVLVVQRSIKAGVEFLFDAWTRVEQLMQWWGPTGVSCNHAEIDLRVGGHYRIGNRFTDGTLVWISGSFEQIDRPHLLVYSWSVEPALRAPERVTVRFDQQADANTLVTITHERIADAATRASHLSGWIGCLDGLWQWAGSELSKQTR